MNRMFDVLMTDLVHVVRELGKDGGQINASVYDSAQVLRLAPCITDPEPGIRWLLQQQQADGGWGVVHLPKTRDMSTLAAVLAIHTFDRQGHLQDVIDAGIDFLHGQSSQWKGELSDDIPVGAELILPRLLHDAFEAGLPLSKDPYQSLIKLGQKRCHMLAQLPEAAKIATTAAHSWESWGNSPFPIPLDQAGSVGHNPSATAAWLQSTVHTGDIDDARHTAQDYLAQAAFASNEDIPGIVPTVWPINRFEQSFGLYALFISGLLDHVAVQQFVQPQLDDLAHAVTAQGLSMSDHFIPDGDDTAVAVAVLHGSGYPIDPSVIRQFNVGDHFCTWSYELQPSISVTAHAAHALNLCGETPHESLRYLVDRQAPDGRWSGDKWHGSWVYATSQVMIALIGTPYEYALTRAVDGLIQHQRWDGGWGSADSNTEETAYSTIALRLLLREGLLNERGQTALERAERWLIEAYRPFSMHGCPLWMGKESYYPPRVARAFELAALSLAMGAQKQDLQTREKAA
ncbi:MAG: prenyltransferase/squalene oxidase repeat-containing protein [Chloroflexota bacterium]